MASRRPLHQKKRVLFLEELARSGNVSLAAKFAGLDRHHAYEARDADPEFAKAWSDAMDAAADLLEQEARRRAYEGVEEPVYGRISREQDGQIGTVQKYSDVLLIFLLKGARPEKYRERRDVTASVQVSSISDLVARVAKGSAGDGGS